MAGYFLFLAAGIDSKTVRWSAPYLDAFGMGEMITGSIPAYNRLGNVPVLLALTAVDILTANVTSLPTPLLEAVLFDMSNKCPDFQMTEQQTCALQGAHKCSYCSTETSSDEPSSGGVDSLVRPPKFALVVVAPLLLLLPLLA